MRVVLFCHSLASDWNHGNAHFLRGVASELVTRGMELAVYEPRDAWSAVHLVLDAGPEALAAWRGAYPELAERADWHRYERGHLDLDAALDGAALVLVHEWNDPELVAAVGRHRAAGGRYHLLFHDTHHRSVTAPEEMAAYDLEGYDGVLAFGEAVRERYLARGWGRRVWTWHEAADARRFRPLPVAGDAPGNAPRDLVWVGNWGDEERTAELHELLLDPVRDLGLTATVHGVRYPAAGRRALAEAGIQYGGYVANFQVPEVFARHRLTVHVPRRPYTEALPGIPTIRPFEALACGIPLVSAPWEDAEGLFRPGDYLVARGGAAMRRHLRDLLADPDRARDLARRGRETVLARHTCGHRVDELLAIVDELEGEDVMQATPATPTPLDPPRLVEAP
ncbi:MAG TPA: glycosyltransferase [Thermoanaerobaculia bacterium]|nr:glycosyltransferase [Thermoanaerobaculia bacterium]